MDTVEKYLNLYGLSWVLRIFIRTLMSSMFSAGPSRYKLCTVRPGTEQGRPMDSTEILLPAILRFRAAAASQ